MENRQLSRQDEILLNLLEDRNNLSFSDMCVHYKVSDRTLRKDLAEIRLFLDRYELSLIKTKNKTFKIDRNSSEDTQKINYLIKKIKKSYCSGHYEFKNDRLLFLLQRMLLSDEYIKIENIADEMYVSKATVSSDLKSVRDILYRYSLSVVNKPYYGMKVVGKESLMRKCILDYGLISEDIFAPNASIDIWSKILNDPDYEVVKRILMSILSNENFSSFKPFLNNMVLHTILAIKRIRLKFYVEQQNYECLENYDQEFLLASLIATKVETILGVSFPISEIKYLQCHLIGKQNQVLNSSNYNDLKYLTDRMLMISSEQYNCNFSEDKILREDLFVHLKSVKSRLEVGTKLRNPMLNEIKRLYPFAFEIAVSSVKNDWNWINMISDDEIGYIAVHFAASLERNNQKYHNKFKNILLICCSGVGTARLMEAKLRQYFNNRINLIVQHSFIDAVPNNFSAYDLILTTQPTKLMHPNVLCVNAIPTSNDLQRIRDFLFGNLKKTFDILDIFQEKYFLIRDSANKENILKEMCGQFVKDGIAESEFYDAVMQREFCTTTCVGNLVAIPHSIKPLSNKSVIYTCIIKNGINWDNDSYVQIIFLLAIKFKDSKWFTEIYDLIVRLVENKEFVYRCVSCNSYEEFINVLFSIKDSGKVLYEGK